MKHSFQIRKLLVLDNGNFVVENGKHSLWSCEEEWILKINAMLLREENIYFVA